MFRHSFQGVVGKAQFSPTLMNIYLHFIEIQVVLNYTNCARLFGDLVRTGIYPHGDDGVREVKTCEGDAWE